MMKKNWFKAVIIILVLGIMSLGISGKGCNPWAKDDDDDNVVVSTGSSGVGPFDLIATAVSSSQIDLTWKHNLDPAQEPAGTGFELQRKTGVAGTYQTIATLGLVTSYQDTPLSSTTTYYYRVSAYHTVGGSKVQFSNWSNEVSATTNEAFATTNMAFEVIDAIGHLDGSGNPVYTRDGINDLDASGLYYPVAIVLDEVNYRLFVADGGNNRVLVYNLNNDFTLPDRIPDFVLGQPDFRSDKRATTQSGLEWPAALAYDSANSRLFVADAYSHRVLVFDVATITNGENAINVLGQTSFTAGGSATTQNRLDTPMGLAYDSTNNRLFVAEYGNHRVMVFDVTTITNGEDAINVLGEDVFTWSSNDVGQNGLWSPLGLAYDSTNNRLFVADGNIRVMVFDVATITDGENAINVLGRPDFTSYNSATTQNEFGTPTGLAYDDANSRLFVADTYGNNRVMVFDVTTITNGENAINVLGQSNFTISTTATTQNGLWSPWGLAYAGDTLFVPDSDNHRVMVFDVTTITDGENAINTIGHIDDVGNPIYTAQGVNNCKATTLYSPLGTVLDTVNHRLFIADSRNNRVLVYNLNNDLALPDGEADFVLGQSDFRSGIRATTQNGFNYPVGLAYDSANNWLFVVDNGNSRVMVFDVATITNGENAINVLGQPDFTSYTQTTTQNGLKGPSGVVYDNANNRLFVADGANRRILVFDITTITDGEDAVNVLGQPDFASNTFATSQNGLRHPSNLAYDSVNNRLFVADYSNNRVLVFDITEISNGENAINVLGQSDFISNTYATAKNRLDDPYDVAYDNTNGWLFVADANNNRVIVFDVTSISNGEDAISVLGQPDFTSKTSATTQNGLRGPRRLAYNSTNRRLFVADMSNNRVMVYTVNY